MVQQLINKASILVEEALPYIQKFQNTVFVVKYGGHAMVSETLKNSVMKDVALLQTFGIKTVLVHGGGPEITKAMKAARIKPVFVHGLRVTDEPTMRIVRTVFKSINHDIRDRLASHGIKSREATSCIQAEPRDPDLGLVGRVAGIDGPRIQEILDAGQVPVVSPVGKKGRTFYNINADTAAVEIAIALRAEKLTILTDVDGVLEKGKTLSHLSMSAARAHIEKGVITSGMIPKVEACAHAVNSGCRKAHLINGTTKHALLFEIFTDSGIGTEIVREARKR